MWSGWIKTPKLVDLEDHNLVLVDSPTRWMGVYRSMQAQFVNDGLKISDTNAEDVRFFTATFIPKRLNNFICDEQFTNDQSIWGIALQKDKAIVFLKSALFMLSSSRVEQLVRHECTHLIIGHGGHDTRYFNVKYNNVW